MKCQYFPGPGQELSPLLSVSVRQADTGTEQVVVVKHTHSSVPRSPFGMLKKTGFLSDQTVFLVLLNQRITSTLQREYLYFLSITTLDNKSVTCIN